MGAPPRVLIDSVALVAIAERKVLVAMSRGKDRWYLPGGKREPGETDEQALRREIREELGVHLRSDTIRHIGTYEGIAHGQPSGTRVRMACHAGRWTGEPRAAGEVERIAFLGFDQVGDTAPVVQDVFRDLRARGLI
jgi:8-oxo-dGTP diphosphatase